MPPWSHARQIAELARRNCAWRLLGCARTSWMASRRTPRRCTRGAERPRRAFMHRALDGRGRIRCIGTRAALNIRCGSAHGGRRYLWGTKSSTSRRGGLDEVEAGRLDRVGTEGLDRRVQHLLEFLVSQVGRRRDQPHLRRAGRGQGTEGRIRRACGCGGGAGARVRVEAAGGAQVRVPSARPGEDELEVGWWWCRGEQAGRVAVCMRGSACSFLLWVSVHLPIMDERAARGRTSASEVSMALAQPRRLTVKPARVRSV